MGDGSIITSVPTRACPLLFLVCGMGILAAGVLEFFLSQQETQYHSSEANLNHLEVHIAQTENSHFCFIILSLKRDKITESP